MTIIVVIKDGKPSHQGVYFEVQFLISLESSRLGMFGNELLLSRKRLSYVVGND